MSNNKYIVKSLAPWMMEELIAFSKLTNFDLILLRKPNEFYLNKLNEIELNGVKIYIKPFSLGSCVKKIHLILNFFFKNAFKFIHNYNAIIGLKSLIWFMKLDLNEFTKESNIHAQFATQASIVSLLIKEYYSNSPQISFTFHAYDIYYQNKWFNLLVEKSHKVFSISKFNINYIYSKYGESKNVVLARLGVARKDLIIKPKIESEFYTIGLMSWFVEKKGIIYLLEALNKLKNDGFENIKLILAGDGPLKNKLLRYVEENDLSEIFQYIGKIDDQQKIDFYNSIDLFILPSIRLKNDQDGIPVVLMEAIAYGLPIISTNISGIPEICIDNYNGKLINEKSVSDIVSAIKFIISNKKTYKKLSSNSLILSDRFDIDLNSRKKIKELKW